MSELPSLADSTLSNTLQALSRALLALGPESDPPDPRLADLITALPRLAESDIDLDGVCPICLVSFRAHLAEEEMASVMESPAHASEDLGVTRLENTCKHMFCRKDISKWIRQARNSCPTCRRPLLPSLSDEPTPGSSIDPSDNHHHLLSNSSNSSHHARQIGSNLDNLPAQPTTTTATAGNNDTAAAATIASIASTIRSTTTTGADVTQREEEEEEGSVVQDNPETAAARLVNDVIRDVLDRLSLRPSGPGLTNTDLHTLLESVLPTLIAPISQTESSDALDLENEQEYPDRAEFGGMYS